MTNQMIGPAIFGLLGVAVLLWLGAWQVQRLAWKQGILADIELRISREPVPLPDAPVADHHKFLAVEITGQLTGDEIHVLASNKDTGAGYRIVTAVQTGGRRIMVDRGFVPTPSKNAVRPARQITIAGNLHWPDEIDSFTPEPDTDKNIWFARDVVQMGESLGAEPVLIVAQSDTGDGVAAFPVDTTSIPNNHLNYAITWFLLAAAWLGMTVFLLLRIKRQSNQ